MMLDILCRDTIWHQVERTGTSISEKLSLPAWCFRMGAKPWPALDLLDSALWCSWPWAELAGSVFLTVAAWLWLVELAPLPVSCISPPGPCLHLSGSSLLTWPWILFASLPWSFILIVTIPKATLTPLEPTEEKSRQCPLSCSTTYEGLYFHNEN